MHFSFSLLRIKGIYMFRAFLAYPRELLHTQHLIYCVCVMSVGCTRIGMELQSIPILVRPTDVTRTQYTKCHLCSSSGGWASNARNMQRPLIRNKMNKSASCWFHYIDVPLTYDFWRNGREICIEEQESWSIKTLSPVINIQLIFLVLLI
jgi:hypothetical protein